MTQERSSSLPRSAAIVGSAVATIVPSMLDMIMPSWRPMKISQTVPETRSLVEVMAAAYETGFSSAESACSAASGSSTVTNSKPARPA